MLINKNGKIIIDDEYEIDEDELKRNNFNYIKNLKFDNKTFNWYILTRKDTSDFELYRNILNRKNLKKTYSQVIKNIKKQGNWRMSFDDLLHLYISKRFNQRILKPMCVNALKNNWKEVNKLALLK